MAGVGLLNTRSRVRKRSGGLSALHTTPYFDFEEATIQPRTLADAAKPRDVLRAACERWVKQGNVIASHVFGVETRGFKRHETGQGREQGEITVVSRGHYEAFGEICDPLGIILIGVESSFMPIVDAAKVLGVDEFWIVGFIHGFDKLNVTLIGKNLEKLVANNNYLEGRRVGMELSGLYIKAEALSKPAESRR